MSGPICGWCLALGILLSACRSPLDNLPQLRPQAVNTPIPEPTNASPLSDTKKEFTGDPPGPVLTITALSTDELLVGVGPVGSVETGFEWQVWLGLGEDWRQLTWPPEATPLAVYSSPSGKEIFAVPFSQATYGPGQAWGLMRSIDDGNSWEQILTGLGDPYVMDLALSPGLDGDRSLYAVTWYDGVFRSVDAGDNWQPLSYEGELQPSGGASPYDLAVAVSPDYTASPEDGRPITGMVLASFGRSLHRWQADAQTWETNPMTVTTPLRDYEPVSAPLSARVIAFSPDFATDRTIYLYSGFAGMFRSVDAGKSWLSVNRWLPEPMPLAARTGLAVISALEAYALLPVVAKEDQDGVTPGDTMFVLFRTLDGGVTWQSLQDPPTWGYVSAFHPSRSEDGAVTLDLGGSQGGVTVHRVDELSWD